MKNSATALLCIALYQYMSTKDRKKAPMVKIGAVYIILQIVFAVQR
ncbi:hypothetical protein BFR10_02515 [Shigella sp. FC1180]|uniref:Uncharacterized protein n=1 Tax=Shigella flexneri 2a str. 301 TaxID=198214 RepID=A0AB36PI71_SHIFL|nr:hypothetical protein SFxv_3515 [Shigella flexneri 2002017]AIL37501.1 hypothetical protein SFy_4571 [Shigella flexneri 2003036]AIL42448.1 hypothetical protein SFyv_4646 [Shigella flexneri Shi06HN006]AMM77815.1 hypothetical protein AOT98_08460 [Shigella flexneri 1a]AMN59486.1 hypothetical protein AD867_18210 [Shigella flexneri 2a]AMN64322.1 hypothetical protein AD871_18400 [Shigella flexneri 4c]EFS13039.1 hypothetical protein SF2457T_3063 [Shigella flexneri 2a str. 2457T]EFZ74500.1 hypothet